MKKIFFGCLVTFCLWLSVGKKTQALPASELKTDEIYVFVRQGCMHCEAAKKDVIKKYPDLKIQWRDVMSRYNRDLAIVCAEKFKLDKSQLGTPLFCMGDHYLLGWNKEIRKQFDEYVAEFLKNKEATGKDK